MAITSDTPLSAPNTPAPARIGPRSAIALQRRENPAFIVLGLISIMSAIVFGGIL